MKSSWAILLLLILCYSVRAEVATAETADDVQAFLEQNQDNTVALFFIDSTHSEGTEGGFWKGIVTSVSHIFSGEEGAEGSQQKAANIEKALANEADLLKIDISNGDLEEVMDTFDVQTVPYIIVIKKGVVVLKEVPTHETHDKILQILNVNPAPVHAEEASEEAEVAPAEPAPAEEAPVEATTEEPTPHTIEVSEESTTAEEPEDDKSLVTKAKDWVGTLFGSDEEEEVEEAPPAEEPAQPVAAAPAPQPAPVAQPRDRPAYPQSSVEPTPDEDMVATSDTRQKWVHHQCHDLATYEDDRASHWRDSPFYISELEDYELPEEWWRNGYKPIKTNSTERMNRYFQGPQTADPNVGGFETYVPAEPVVYVAPVERFEPYYAPRPEPVIVAEPIVRPEPVRVVEPKIRPEPVRVVEPKIRPEPVIVAEPRLRPQPVVVAEPHLRQRAVAPQRLVTNTTAPTVGRTTTRSTTGTPSAPKQVSRREVTGQAPTTQTTAPTTTRVSTGTAPRTTSTTRPATTSTRPASTTTSTRTTAGPRPSSRTSASATTVKPTASSRR